MTPPPPPRSSTRLVPLLVLAAGLATTALATVSVARSLATARSRREAAALQQTRDDLAHRMESYATILAGTRALLVTQEGQTGPAFRSYVADLELDAHYPGLQGVGFAEVIPAGGRAAVEARIRQEFPDFRIWPGAAASTAIVSFEPQSPRNRPALGYDMSSEPTRREAMERARDTGHPAATAPLVLVSDRDRPNLRGFLVYLPYYGSAAPQTVEERRASLRGYVYAPFQARQVFESSLGATAVPLAALVYDGAPEDGRRLYGEPPLAKNASRLGDFHRAELTVAGRTWTLLRPAGGPDPEPERRLPLGVALAGLVGSLLLAGLTRAEVEARLLAERRARRAQLLAEAGRALSGTLAKRQVLETSVRLAVPNLAPWAQAELRQEDGDLALRLEAADGPLLPGGSSPPPNSLPERADFPLLARGATLGALQLAAPAGALTHETRALAAELAALCASALDSAILFERAQAAVQLRDDFVSIASHELKTPVAAAHLQLQVALRRLDRLVAEGTPLGEAKLRQLLDGARRQTARLASLISTLLDLTQIQGGRMQLLACETDLAELARDVAARHADELALAESRLELHAPAPVVGRWDRVRLEQVVTNLLSNAMKYGRGKPIELAVEGSAEEARLVVRDRGIGIAPEETGRIFDRYARAAPVLPYGGLGLGLYIVREIVTALGGSVEVRSALGEGSTFEVRLPRGERAPTAPAPVPPRS